LFHKYPEAHGFYLSAKSGYVFFLKLLKSMGSMAGMEEGSSDSLSSLHRWALLAGFFHSQPFCRSKNQTVIVLGYS
jgi:hypothetical protein